MKLKRLNDISRIVIGGNIREKISITFMSDSTILNSGTMRKKKLPYL